MAQEISVIREDNDLPSFGTLVGLAAVGLASLYLGLRILEGHEIRTGGSLV